MKTKHLFLHIRLLLLLLSFGTLAGCFSLPAGSPPEDSCVSGIPSPTPSFEEFTLGIFCDEISSDTISLHYTLADPAAYGIDTTPITLGSVKDTSGSDEAVILYEQLICYDRGSLSVEEQLTYDTLERYLNILMEDTYSPYLSELLGPVTGFQAQLPILLAEYRFDDAEDVNCYLALLESVYDFFKELAEFEKEKSINGYFMDDATAEEILLQCKDFLKNPDENYLISTFEERLSHLPLSLSEKTEYSLQNRSALYTYVFPAYELLVDTLTECLGSGKNPYGMSYYSDGRDYYALLAKASTGSDRTIEELKRLLTDAIDASCLTMATALKSDSSLYTTALHPVFPETDPDDIIQYVVLQSEEDFPLMDCGDYEIKYIPAALQEYVSPAMYLVPPMDRYESNVIYINPNPLYDADTLFPTVVHEGYPGHLYQTVSSLSGEVSPLRYLLSPTGYEEGWATYVEHYCYKYAGFSEPLCSFLQADQTGTLCLYALADIYIHHDGYTPEQLSDVLMVYGFPKESADLIYQTLLSEPGVYLPYAVGLLEFLELRDLAETTWEEDYSDYRFHSFLIETGPLPFPLLKAELLQ